ncbi:UTP--glucose-1-phosphate uridylyltransferase [Corynebacterium spheniscorum]|uniref:UTP--glucose-1-phosphate uridylyltransferase n=2 Tax=Corynebacterium spheniscorum TaxID=185761 RepID=A0A1I2V3X1_9CORY|nr:UTP--glucose-1-phosphate uridylyltransferase [Corynebacterium spheniscorum]
MRAYPVAKVTKWLQGRMGRMTQSSRPDAERVDLASSDAPLDAVTAVVAVRTVVVPAAGLGTRFLPATKTVPKELLPVVDRPGIEIIAEEAAEAGAEKLAIITAPGKAGVLKHFGEFPDLEALLGERGKDDQLKKVRRAREIIRPVAVTQDKPLGLGHAVGIAESVLDDDEDAFAVMLPDDLVLPTGVLSKMAEVRAKFGGSVLCAVEVPRSQVFNYGVFDLDLSEEASEDCYAIRGMVEKPDPEEAPSNFVATGRYLLDRKIFDALRRITPGKGGELQLTDAIALLLEEGHPVHIVVHRGKRHDLGNPGGYIPACVDFGLHHDTYGPHLYEALSELLKEYEAEHPEVKK